jgi:hypothetical protein
VRDYEGERKPAADGTFHKTSLLQETTMITTNAKLNALDALFTLTEQIERVDYVAVGERIIYTAATIAAIITGVVTYLITALQLFWLDNGERIIINAVRLTFIIIDAIGATYYLGRNLRPTVNRLVAQLADGVYYMVAAL